jgi:hypothetical protein
VRKFAGKDEGERGKGIQSMSFIFQAVTHNRFIYTEKKNMNELVDG